MLPDQAASDFFRKLSRFVRSDSCLKRNSIGINERKIRLSKIGGIERRFSRTVRPRKGHHKRAPIQ
jgi:hypothetical protein